MENKNSKIEIKKKGFTLTEMLVSVMIFSIIISSISGILVSSIREQRKTLASQTLLDQASYDLEFMARALRMARKQLTGDPYPACLPQDGFNYGTTTIDGVTALTFINHLQNDDCQAFYLKNGQLKYKKGIGAIEQTLDLSSKELTVNSFNFNFSGEDQIDTLQPRVTFALEISSGEFVPGSRQRIKLQSTISQRLLDIVY